MSYMIKNNYNLPNASSTVLRDKTFKTMNDSKYNGYQRCLASMVYNLFIKNLPVEKE